MVYTAGSPTVPDLTNNRTHGYESFRDPNVPGTTAELHYGAAPSDLDQNGNQTVVGGVNLDVPGGTQTIPTFNQFVNTYFSINPATGLYDPTANLNEANEMNLYAPGGGFPLDQSFGHGDLEWLYRGQDVDADALQSRLADLCADQLHEPRRRPEAPPALHHGDVGDERLRLGQRQPGGCHLHGREIPGQQSLPLADGRRLRRGRRERLGSAHVDASLNGSLPPDMFLSW